MRADNSISYEFLTRFLPFSDFSVLGWYWICVRCPQPSLDCRLERNGVGGRDAEMKNGWAAQEFA